jgi:hypothetical protein
LKNGSGDQTHRQEAYAINDHVRQLLLLQDHSIARPNSIFKFAIRIISKKRVGDKPTYREDARVDLSKSNLYSTRNRGKMSISCDSAGRDYLPCKGCHVDQCMWLVFRGRVVDSIWKKRKKNQ